jgi:hypothetical protein
MGEFYSHHNQAFLFRASFLLVFLRTANEGFVNLRLSVQTSLSALPILIVTIVRRQKNFFLTKYLMAR